MNEETFVDSREASDSGDEVPGIYADEAYNSKAVARANVKRSSVRAVFSGG